MHWHPLTRWHSHKAKGSLMQEKKVIGRDAERPTALQSNLCHVGKRFMKASWNVLLVTVRRGQRPYNRILCPVTQNVQHNSEKCNWKLQSLALTVQMYTRNNQFCYGLWLFLILFLNYWLHNIWGQDFNCTRFFRETLRALGACLNPFLRRFHLNSRGGGFCPPL